MVRPYIHTVFPPFVANICRITGILPLSWSCDNEGLPIFSSGLFSYSLCLALFNYLCYLLNALTVPSKSFLVKLVDLLIYGNILILIILSSIIQCKRGLTENIVRLLKNVDDELKCLPTIAQYDFTFLVLSLFSVLQFWLFLQTNENIYEDIIYSLFAFITHSNYLALYYTVKSVKTRLALLNTQSQQRCPSDANCLSGNSLSVPVLKKAHYLLGEAIFLVNCHSGLQYLSSFIYSVSSIIYSDVFRILEAYEITTEVIIPEYFLTQYIDHSTILLQVLGFTTIVWICSGTSVQARKLLSELICLKKRTMDPAIGKQIHTLQLQLPYHCTEFTAAGLFTMKLSVVFSTFGVMLFNIVLGILQG